jgi:hypothetical protein
LCHYTNADAIGVTYCSETKGAVTKEGTVFFVIVIGMVGIVAPFPSRQKKGLLLLGEIGYIMFLSIIENCMLCNLFLLNHSWAHWLLTV